MRSRAEPWEDALDERSMPEDSLGSASALVVLGDVDLLGDFENLDRFPIAGAKERDRKERETETRTWQRFNFKLFGQCVTLSDHLLFRTSKSRKCLSPILRTPRRSRSLPSV